MTPIEQKMWDALAEQYRGSEFYAPFTEQQETLASLCELHEITAYGGRFFIASAPQVRHLSYVLDIAMVIGCGLSPGRPPLVLNIECDGHDFHERTKEQAARDRSRDRTLLADGVVVIRFTGSEIWHRADDCASEVTAAASAFLNREHSWLDAAIARKRMVDEIRSGGRAADYAT